MNKLNAIKGVGVGLRLPHLSNWLNDKPHCDFLELLTDNHLKVTRGHMNSLSKLRQNYPMSMHGVGMSIGGSSALDIQYLKEIKSLAEELNVHTISDHLCFSEVKTHHFHDLLPLPFKHYTIDHLIPRIEQAQDILQRPLILENISAYAQVKDPDFHEVELWNEIHKKTGCSVLLDLNNIWVNHVNLEHTIEDWFQYLTPSAIAQFHLGGHENKGSYLLDTHGSKISPDVWSLYKRAKQQWPEIATLIEWDNNLPPIATLLEERDIAVKI